MNGIGGRLGGFINPYLQTNQRKATQKPAEEEPKLKDVKPQGNESTQPKRDETKYYEQGEDGNLKLIKEENDGFARDKYIFMKDGSTIFEHYDENGKMTKTRTYPNGTTIFL